ILHCAQCGLAEKISILFSILYCIKINKKIFYVSFLFGAMNTFNDHQTMLFIAPEDGITASVKSLSTAAAISRINRMTYGFLLPINGKRDTTLSHVLTFLY